VVSTGSTTDERPGLDRLDHGSGSTGNKADQRRGPEQRGPDAGRWWATGILERVTSLDPAIAGRLKRSADGLVPAVAQQHDTGEVLMLGWMDDEALARTLTTGRATYWSRSRQEYWVKGDTSGHVQWVKEVRLDCDGDTLLLRVDQVGAACHTGDRTCFDADVLLAGTEVDTETNPVDDAAHG
jgi:phosphoribosyl-AMP cyclohydrolase